MVEGKLANFCQLIFWESQLTVLLKTKFKKQLQMNEYIHNHSCEEGCIAKSRNVIFKKNILDRLHFQNNIILHYHS
jgi:hypothetical protein